MKRAFFLVIALVLSSFVTATAQQWSPEQQEVIDNLEECWDIWQDNVKSGSPEGWISECATPDLTYWVSSDSAPLNNDYNRRTWGVDSGTGGDWVDIRPISITVLDDIAVLHFYGYGREMTKEEGGKIREAKRT